MKEYMMQFSDGFSISRIMVKLRNCPFCKSEPEINGMRIFCSSCGAEALANDDLKNFRGFGDNICGVRFYVNVWNGFLKYDENNRPIPDLYHRFM